MRSTYSAHLRGWAPSRLNAFSSEDATRDVVEMLKTHVSPLHAEIKQNVRKLHLHIEYLNDPSRKPIPKSSSSYNRGVIGTSCSTLTNAVIATSRERRFSTSCAPISEPRFLHFRDQSPGGVSAKIGPIMLAAQLSYIGLDSADLKTLEGTMNRSSWLGTAERLVFEAFRTCAPYVSPFSINNPNGTAERGLFISRISIVRVKYTTTSFIKTAALRPTSVVRQSPQHARL